MARWPRSGANAPLAMTAYLGEVAPFFVTKYLLRHPFGLSASQTAGKDENLTLADSSRYLFVSDVWVKSRTFLHAILRQVMKEGSAMEATRNHEAAE